MPSFDLAAEGSRFLAASRSALIENSDRLKLCLRHGPAALAGLLVVCAATIDTGPAPTDLAVPHIAVPSVDLERDGWVTLFELGQETVERPAAPLATAAVETGSGSPESWLKPEAGTYLADAQVTTVEPSMISVEAGGTAQRPQLARRFEALAAPDSSFAAALQRAGSNSYRERFASRAGRLSQSLARLAQRAEALADRERAATGSGATQPTVATQIRRNSESMPTTVHLSTLLARRIDAGAVTQQAAVTEPTAPRS